MSHLPSPGRETLRAIYAHRLDRSTRLIELQVDQRHHDRAPRDQECNAQKGEPEDDVLPGELRGRADRLVRRPRRGGLGETLGHKSSEACRGVVSRLSRSASQTKAPPSASAATRYARPSGPQRTGTTVTPTRTIAYHRIWRVVSRVPRTTGSIGIRAAS